MAHMTKLGEDSGGEDVGRDECRSVEGKSEKLEGKERAADTDDTGSQGSVQGERRNGSRLLRRIEQWSCFLQRGSPESRCGLEVPRHPRSLDYVSQ